MFAMPCSTQAILNFHINNYNVVKVLQFYKTAKIMKLLSLNILIYSILSYNCIYQMITHIDNNHRQQIQGLETELFMDSILILLGCLCIRTHKRIRLAHRSMQHTFMLKFLGLYPLEIKLYVLRSMCLTFHSSSSKLLSWSEIHRCLSLCKP